MITFREFLEERNMNEAKDNIESLVRGKKLIDFYLERSINMKRDITFTDSEFIFNKSDLKPKKASLTSWYDKWDGNSGFNPFNIEVFNDNNERLTTLSGVKSFSMTLYDTSIIYKKLSEMSSSVGKSFNEYISSKDEGLFMKYAQFCVTLLTKKDKKTLDDFVYARWQDNYYLNESLFKNINMLFGVSTDKNKYQHIS